jgi:regulatory protein
LGAVDEARAWLAAQGVTVDEPPASPAAGPPDSPRAHVSTAEPEQAAAAADDAQDDRDSRPDTDPEGTARAIVLRKLAAQARTRYELEQALVAKQVPDAVSKSVLDRFQAAGLVDDAAFAADWVESRQSRRHLSATALRRELRAKGVDADDIDVALSVVDADDEYATALDLARRRQRSMDQLPREVQYRRLAGMLGRRGFGPGATARVLAEVLRLS